MLLTCPVCKKKSLNQTATSISIDYFGEVIILTQKCSNCGYKHVDVFPAEIKEPSEYLLEVKTKDDLYAKVVRSSSGEVRIPELGLEMTPGPAAQGFITNVEGILMRFENILEGRLVTESDEKKRNKIKSILKKIKMTRDLKIPFTIILKDKYGNSAIASKNARKRKLNNSHNK